MNEVIAMKGGGYYSLATLGAKHVIDGATPLVLDAIAAMPDSREAFVFADMGTADGGTSRDLVERVVETVRRRWPAREIALVYTDQPRNDFNALVADCPRPGAGRRRLSAVLRDLLPSPDPAQRQPRPGLLRHRHALAQRQALRHLRPCPGGGRLGEPSLPPSPARAMPIGSTILLQRARELRPGGRLVLVNFCRDEEGRYLGRTGGVDMFGTFNLIWRDLVQAGTIGEAEYRAMTLPQYYKDLGEFTRPLTEPGDPVHQAGLRLERAETRVVPCPFAAEFRRKGDAAAFAKAYIPTLRSWTESSFFAGLDPARSMEERRRIIDGYYADYERRVRQAPEGHGMDYVHAYLTIARV